MIPLSIKVKEKDSPELVDPVSTDAKQLQLKTATIIEGGTGRGRTAVTFHLMDDEGKDYYVQTTGRLMANGLAAAIKGAAARFGDNLDEA